MAFRVQVGPPQIAIHAGQTVLVTDSDGEVRWPTERGLYFFDTRVISSWLLYANGEKFQLLNGGAITPASSRVFATNTAFLTEAGEVPARALALVVSRTLDGGMHEDVDLTNHSMHAVGCNLELAIRSDFADIFDVKSKRNVRRGRITSDWDFSAQTLTTRYVNADFVRAVRIRVLHADAVFANGRLSFGISLEPGQSFHACLLYDLTDDARDYPAPTQCSTEGGAQDAAAHAGAMQDWRDVTLKIECSNEEFYRLFHQALEDLAALRLPIEGTSHTVFMPAAGLPWFVAPFGRDSLIVSLQSAIASPRFAEGSLEVLGRLQATERDDYRDAEPGKILHELRYGELAHFKLIPHTPYYGTADATPLWLITLHEAWRCTGDDALLQRHLPVAERCLAWIDESGDLDDDGFQEYQTRSTAGYENMGWKDSGDAVMYEDGTLVRGPKALCELQGYVYDAWLRMAEIFAHLCDPRAENLRAKAARLFDTFNEKFWSEERGFYAYCLDGTKTPVWSVASNAGHLLWSGIVPPERAKRVVARFMEPDLFSGWGLRTLSAKHCSFNPYAYQLGSVWPHDNGIIALGMKRYGFGAEASLIARDISRAASHFEGNQLPELYAGIQREGTNFPVQYIGANVPQAWAAGSVFMLLQAILGLVPDAPGKMLYVDPALPDWLPDVTLRHLSVGDAEFAVRFFRNDAETRFEVVSGDPARVQRRSATALHAGLRGV